MNLLTAITELISIFLFTTLFIFVARKAAKKVGLVDKPNYRKRHQGLVPLVGGISVYAGICFTFAIADYYIPHSSLYLACAGILVLVGALDDRFDISVKIRAVIQAAMEAGARRVYLIEEPLAAALGAHLDVNAPEGHMVVDIGGGTTDIGVITMNGVAVSSSIKVAGIEFDEAIIKYVRKHYGVIIGANTAEEIKLSIGCVSPRPASLTMTVKGRDVRSGLAHEITVNSEELMDVLRRPARQIADKVLDVLEQTTPELVADISKNGILLTGGGSQLWGMDQILRDRTEISCVVADDADSCVAYGCGKSLSWMNHMQEGTINISRRRLLKE